MNVQLDGCDKDLFDARLHRFTQTVTVNSAVLPTQRAACGMPIYSEYHFTVLDEDQNPEKREMCGLCFPGGRGGS